MPTLERAEKEFGVPKEIITAILGVETRYGNIQGKDRVLDSLTTLGFDYPRRAEFFRNELIKFFILTRENNLDIYSVKGCLLYTSPSPRDAESSRMPSSA